MPDENLNAPDGIPAAPAPSTTNWKAIGGVVLVVLLAVKLFVPFGGHGKPEPVVAAVVPVARPVVAPAPVRTGPICITTDVYNSYIDMYVRMTGNRAYAVDTVANAMAKNGQDRC